MLPEWVLWVLRVVTYGYSATYLIYFSREIQHYLDGLALSSTPLPTRGPRTAGGQRRARG